MSLNLSENTDRGLESPEIVDLIQKHQDGERVELVILMEPALSTWSDEKQVISSLEEKFNNYLDYILDGHFLGQYPQYKSSRAVITLEGSKELEGRVVDLVEAMKSFCFTVGIDLEQRVVQA